MRSGRKRQVEDHSSLPFRPTATGSLRFEVFCRRFIRVPKGRGALSPLLIHPFQRDLVGSVMDAPTPPLTAGFMLPRGSGKTTLMAAWGLYELMTGGEGATVIVCATDERQAALCFNTARRMVELHEDLAKRVQIYKTELVVPSRNATFTALPATPDALEGLDFSLAIVDEIGVVSREVYEVLQLAQGKREKSVLVGIGTPSVKGLDSVLGDLRTAAAEHPDPTRVWREWSAAEYIEHPVDCRHCWHLANPAMAAGFMTEESLVALLPPTVREASFRRARLCQFASETEGQFIPADTWEDLGTGRGVPDGAEVVLSFDGSFSDDTTALLVATIDAEPHLDVVEIWERPKGDDAYRVPVEEVENAIRKACLRWSVVEVIADPFRWTRSLQILERDELPIYEYPQSPSRMTAATSDFYSAAMNRKLSHSGDPRLALHIANAVVSEDGRGIRLTKSSRSRRAGKIDLAVCAVMAHSRATWRATKRKPRRRVVSY